MTEARESGRGRALCAEALGTFALVFFGCGAAVIDARGGGLGHGGVALSFGLVIAIMIYATGPVSGAHFNPAVTLALASVRLFSWSKVPLYILSQCGAAMFGSLLLWLVFGTQHGTGEAAPTGGVPAALVVEVVCTATLLVTIVSVVLAGATRQVAGAAVGATVGLCALVGGPVSGAALNPARWLGPALISGHWQHGWLYLLGPLVGALLGAWGCLLMSGERAITAEAAPASLERADSP